MDEKRKEEEVRKLTPEEIDDMIFEEQIESGEYDEEASNTPNPDPYAKSSLAPMMHQSVTSSLMRTVTLL
ncbi:MAG: hypothetical protein ACLRWH_10755 [Emergencia sp.]